MNKITRHDVSTTCQQAISELTVLYGYMSTN